MVRLSGFGVNLSAALSKEEGAVDRCDLGAPHWPKIPAIEAVGDVGRHHKIFIAIQAPTMPPNWQESAVRIMACGIGDPIAIDEEPHERVADPIAGTGSDRLHEEEACRQVVTKLALIAPGSLRDLEGGDLTDCDLLEGAEIRAYG